jgi:hypothetical protein
MGEHAGEREVQNPAKEMSKKGSVAGRQAKKCIRAMYCCCVVAASVDRHRPKVERGGRNRSEMVSRRAFDGGKGSDS